MTQGIEERVVSCIRMKYADRKMKASLNPRNSRALKGEEMAIEKREGGMVESARS